MIDSLTDMSMEGTFTIEEADLKKLQEVLCDIKIEECPWFEVHDKYGSSAKYYRDGLIDTKAEELSNDSPELDKENGELIRRKAAIEAMKEAFNPSITNFVKAKLAIENLPPAQPEPQSRMVFGYPLEYLAAFAEACRRAGVDESDLKIFANNCEFAYATMEEEHRQHINQVIEAFMGNAGGANASD